MGLWGFVQLIWRGKWLMIASVAVAVGVATLLISMAEPRYRAQAVLRIVSNDRLNSLTNVPGGISSLASLAGFNVGASEEIGVALGTLKARSFTSNFIRDRNLMPLLFPDRWDLGAKKWIGPPPTISQAVDMFDKGGLRKVVEDRRTGFIVLQIEWRDPAVASEWLQAMVASVNRTLREQKLQEAAKSVAYLEKRLAQTQAVEVREAAYRLMEVQMKDMMVASTQEDYALKYVDSPITQVAPQDRVWPRPLLMIAVALLAGGMFGLILTYLFVSDFSPWVIARRSRTVARGIS